MSRAINFYMLYIVERSLSNFTIEHHSIKQNEMTALSQKYTNSWFKGIISVTFRLQTFSQMRFVALLTFWPKYNYLLPRNITVHVSPRFLNLNNFMTLTLNKKINLHSQKKKIGNYYGNKPRKKITNNLVCVVMYQSNPRAFEFLENVCSNFPLPRPKSCSNAPS